MIAGIKQFLQKRSTAITEKPAAVAYDLWSASYDNQPGNLMLTLDEALFSKLLTGVQLENQIVADIGCGTGRHWDKLYALRPGLVMGFDVSEGMLEQLRQKFPDSITRRVTDDLLSIIPDQSVDCIVSTLTIAHIKNIRAAIRGWSRVTRHNADVIITDFHPALLANGGRRSFTHAGKRLAVTNYVHSLDTVQQLFREYGFTVVRAEEKHITEEVKQYYAAQNALHVYEQYKGLPLIYGLHLKKDHGAE